MIELLLNRASAAGIPLTREQAEKLNVQRPRSLGLASRIPGVSLGDITASVVWLKSLGPEAEVEE